MKERRETKRNIWRTKEGDGGGKRKFKREIERQEDGERVKSREKLSKESYRIILLDLRE